MDRTTVEGRRVLYWDRCEYLGSPVKWRDDHACHVESTWTKLFYGPGGGDRSDLARTFRKEGGSEFKPSTWPSMIRLLRQEGIDEPFASWLEERVPLQEEPLVVFITGEGSPSQHWSNSDLVTSTTYRIEESAHHIYDVVDLLRQVLWGGRTCPDGGEWESVRVMHYHDRSTLLHLVPDDGAECKWKSVGPTPWPVDRVYRKWQRELKGEVSHAD